MTRKCIISLFALLLSCAGARAQFYSTGNEPASLKWYRVETENYRLIYPQGLDSLAKVFGRELEQMRGPVGRSIGFLPNQSYRRKMPVVLHPLRTQSNGLVAWTPRRMELYTVPDAYSPESLVWEKELAVHESRHVAQMQFGRYRGFKPLHWLIGELSTGALSAVYPGPAFLEGDAVTAETALSTMGRGRNADFLADIRYAFDNGDRRNWYQWRYGSIKKNTPDYYRLGYMTIAGMRTVYDEPLFTEKYYVRIFDRYFGYPFYNFKKTVRDVSGKRFKEAWEEVGDAFQHNWEENARARAPFQELRQLTQAPRYYTEYTRGTTDGESFYAIESGLRTSRNLVKISADGSVERLRPFSYITGDLIWSEAQGRLYWSETLQDKRWTLKEYSDICYLVPGEKTIHFLTSGQRYFNPAPSPDGCRLAVVEYPSEGGSAVVVLDSTSGDALERFDAPNGLQVVECAWKENGLVVTGIDRDGFSIYDPASFGPILGPTPQHIRQLRGHDGFISFISDRDGVSEVYVLDSEGVRKCSSTRYGVSDHIIKGDSLYVSAQADGGKMLFALPFEKGEAVDFGEYYKDPIAEELSAQEKELETMNRANGEDSFSYKEASEVAFSDVTRFRRLPNLIRIHSWAPLYVNYNKVQSISFDQLYMSAAPGATVFFQNDLGFSGFAGVSYHKDPNEEEKYRTSFHANLVYTGLYPVFELNLDFGDRNLYQYTVTRSGDELLSMTSFAVRRLGVPAFSGNVKAYVPLRFSRGGWNRGLIPQIQWGFGSDRFNTGVTNVHYENTFGGNGSLRVFDGFSPGSNLLMNKVVATLRAYNMLSTPPGGIYPRLGVGAELGVGGRPGLGKLFTPNAFAYFYGYVPGFVQGHSVRLTAEYQHEMMNATRREAYLTTTPRGFADYTGVMKYIQNCFPSQSKLTADYAFATLPMDWAGLGNLAYVRNLEVSFIGDLGMYGSSLPDPSKNLYSVGASLAFHLCNFLWVPYDTHLGFTYTFNGGSLIKEIKAAGTECSRHYVGLVFGIDIY